MKQDHFPLIIVGAGAAGLGASNHARKLEIPHVVIEASHRIGGRGLTETMDNGVAVDLGCHWMHSASLNPMVEHADRLGFHYKRTNPASTVFADGRWQEEGIAERWVEDQAAIEKSMKSAAESSSNRSIWDFVDSDSEHALWLGYWYGLMHSNDPDEVDIADILDYVETDEDWPVQDGYGALIAAAGADAPVWLNCPVSQIDFSKGPVQVTTARGELTADHVVVTVSTGVLGSGDITFVPALPADHQRAIASLPLGNYNNLIFALTPDGLSDAPAAVAYQGESECAYIKIRPFGRDFLFTSVAGRFAWWLERQGERASEDWLRQILIEIFGAEVNAALGQFRASAWGYDPWVKGAYSSLKPGAGPMRSTLAKSIEGRLHFAGEATSPEAFDTAHGAWQSGESAVSRVFGSE